MRRLHWCRSAAGRASVFSRFCGAGLVRRAVVRAGGNGARLHCSRGLPLGRFYGSSRWRATRSRRSSGTMSGTFRCTSASFATLRMGRRSGRIARYSRAENSRMPSGPICSTACSSLRESTFTAVSSWWESSAVQSRASRCGDGDARSQWRAFCAMADL